MRSIAMYRIPRKRKVCVIVYKDQIFTRIEELETELLEVKKFSKAAVDLILESLPTVDEETMNDILKELNVSSDVREKYLTGVPVTDKEKTTFLLEKFVEEHTDSDKPKKKTVKKKSSTKKTTTTKRKTKKKGA